MDFVSLLGSLISIAILTFIAWRLFPTTPVLSIERVRRNIARFSPEIEPKSLETMEIFLSDEKKAAICLFPDHPDWIAITKAQGDRVVVRFYPDRNNLTVQDQGHKVVIRQSDFTFPPIAVIMAPEAKNKILNITPVSKT
jgi:hypothetical protein